MSKLLTRDQFREAVFDRDGSVCVFCSEPAVDAHHILERRLWGDGGYYADNGVSVCREHHLQCERTLISSEDCREAAGIRKAILPEHLYPDQVYDKWGNPILPNGQRLKGDLFWDESVQKVLAEGGVLDLFTHYVKYPRTFHLKHSPGRTIDDRVHATHDQWEGKDVVVHLKMDGENFTMYTDYSHARSIDSGNHISRNWAKNFHSKIQGDIPLGWRICSENLYAKHSIYYDNLESYVLAFSIWDDRNNCLGWDETQDWFELLNLPQVPVLYEGPFSESIFTKIENKLDLSKDEGYVLRIRDSFHYRDFRKFVGKYVRKNHIHTVNHHWRFQPIVPNQLK